MTPRVKHQLGLTMLHIYRGVILCMLSFCTFFLHEFYLTSKKYFADTEILKQSRSEDKKENELKHLVYDADLRELKDKVNKLFEERP